MKSELRFDGFYETGPVPWEDWHAGVQMHGVHFHYQRFYADETWFGCYRDQPFDFWQFSESIGTKWKEQLADGGGAHLLPGGDPEFLAGSYVVDQQQLTLTLRSSVSTGLKWEFLYRLEFEKLVQVNSPNTAVDYHFVSSRTEY